MTLVFEALLLGCIMFVFVELVDLLIKFKLHD